ncbi:flavodoxin family protein [Nocardioides mangrovi]|uniref:Flavodoxin-like domain-containing protein n=1 Tax=Nocardioides mangrovi TaxID=2874580 RepID=A0ABS7U893_9ACTN|nr:flavodoxin-like domain-containing protein [Nocardioides mangrovi]MBZ5736956.1 flavodoxin-like domain-containing protein [Nocardioides mangrovi]
MSETTSPGRPRALVVHESMFGCTEQVARAVADGLAESGFTVTALDVAAARGTDPASYDLLVVGAPTHAFSLSRPSTRRDAVAQGGRPDAEAFGLREWIGDLPQRSRADRRPFAAFDTRMSKVRRLPKSAATRATRLLAHRGYRPAVRPAPFIVEDTQGPLAPGELERAHEWGRSLARTVAPSAAAG